MTVNVTNAVGANNTIVLDGSSKIPAFDGSLVTALSATAFTTGTLATARIDVGTTAGKILQLDGSARLPALSGANLVNAPGPTVSTSDPAIDTNPTLGAKWINKTSGEVYICTDATTDENVWTNVGAGSGNVEPATWYGGRGLFGGGYHFPSPQGPTNVIDYVTISTTGNAIDFGDLTQTRNNCPAFAGGGRAIWNGGANDPGTGALYNIMDYVTISTPGNAVDFGDLTLARKSGGSCSNGYRGITGGGLNNPGTTYNTIDYATIASAGNAIDFGDLSSARGYVSALSSETRGVFGGGNNGNIIEYVTIATTGNTTDFGDLTVGRSSAPTCSSTTRGLFMGGHTGAATSNVIDYITTATPGNATDFGDLSSARAYGGACGNAIRGLHTGGYPYTNVIDYITIATPGNAVDFGDLTMPRSIDLGGCSGD